MRFKIDLSIGEMRDARCETPDRLLRLASPASRILLCFLLLALPLLSYSQPQQLAKQARQQRSADKGEEQRRSEQVGEAVTLSSELVLVDATVVDKQGRVVVNLDKSSFTVYENNEKQEIAFFSREESPISLGLTLDTSGSMKKKLNRVIAAAKSLVHQSHPQDEVFVIEFKAEAELIQDFTSDLEEIQDALDNMIASGQTALLDAAYLAVEHAQKHGKYRRKAIVLVTDGEERDSYYSRDQVLQALRQSDVQVYAIGFPQGLGEAAIFQQTESRRMSGQEKRARKLLEELAQVSGGRAFFPESLDELDSIASTIASELRMQYALGYYPTNPQRDGSWRTIRVEVAPDKVHGKLVVRTRSGYYAAKPPSGSSPPSQRRPQGAEKQTP